MTRLRVSRRDFLRQGATAAGAATTVPYIFSSSRAAAQNSEELKIAAVGVGGSRGRYNRGGRVARQASNFGRMVAVCDVDRLHNDQFADWCKEKKDVDINKYVDYREMLEKEKPDVVTIGTPDHWHVPISIAALRAGAHVYCEKPLTLTIDEGKQVCDVVKETGKTFQVGSQQRTEYNQMFLKAIALAQNGFLGENLKAYVAIGGAPTDGPFETTAVPEGLDWDFWVGPAPAVDYCEQRRRMFRWWFEYSGGKMTDWGAHHIDIAQWALGQDETAPVAASGEGVFGDYLPEYDPVKFLNGEITLPNGYNTAGRFHIDLEFPNGTTMSVNDHVKVEEQGADFGNGILLVGDKPGAAGRLFVNRGRLSGAPVESLTESEQKFIDEEVVKLYRGKNPKDGHMANFFQCIADGGLPISNVFTHHRSMTSCHICNITLMLDRPVKFDPEKQQFIDDADANALMTREQRQKYLA